MGLWYDTHVAPTLEDSDFGAESYAAGPITQPAKDNTDAWIAGAILVAGAIGVKILESKGHDAFRYKGAR